MATSNLPAPVLQPLQPLPPVADEKNLLAPQENAGSCCGGGSCSVD